MERAKKRLDHEYKSFPLDYIKVNFKKETFLEWHFLFIGQNGTPFEGGEYHGTLIFPENYPLSPPTTQIITPNGRFQTNERVCFSISDFHPENWKPAYTMSSFLQGVYSFMMTDTTDTVGSLVMGEEEIRKLAKKSRKFNKSNDSYNEMFKDRNDETINPLITSTASDPLMKVPTEISRSDHNSIRNTLVTRRPRRSLSVPVHESDRESRVDDEKEFTSSIASGSLTKVPPRSSRSDHSDTKDKLAARLFGKILSIPVPKSDRDSRVDNEKEFAAIVSDPLTKAPSERSRADHSNTREKLVTCPPKRHTASSHTVKLQISESQIPNSSTADRTSPIKHIGHSCPPNLSGKDRLTQYTNKNRFMNSSSLHSPSSIKGEVSYTSKLLERTLPERSNSTSRHSSATSVSQHREKHNTVRSSDYASNNIARDNYNRVTTEISKRNKEFSPEKSSGRLSKKTISNRPMNNSSLHSRTFLTESTIPQTARYDKSTHFSEEFKKKENVSVHNYPIQSKVLHKKSTTVKSDMTCSVRDTVSSKSSKPQVSPPFSLTSSNADQTSSMIDRSQFHSINSPAKASSNDGKTPHLSTSSAILNKFFQGTTVNKFAFNPPLNSSNSSTAQPSSPNAQIVNQSQSLNTAEDESIQNTNSNESMTSSSLLSPTSLHTCRSQTTRDNVSMLQTDHTLSSLTCNQSGIPPVIPDSSKEFSPKSSQPNLTNTSDKWSVNLPKGSTPLPTQVLSELSQEDTLTMNQNVTFSGNLKDAFSSNTDETQESTSNVPISSAMHPTSTKIHKDSSYFPTTTNRVSQNSSSNSSTHSSTVHSPTSLAESILPQTTRYARTTQLSEESKTVSLHKADHLPNSTDRENVDDAPFSEMDSDSVLHTFQNSNARIDKDLTRDRVLDLENSNLPPPNYPSEPLPSQVLTTVSHEESFTASSNLNSSDDLRKTVYLGGTKPQMPPPYSHNSATTYQTSSMMDRNPISPVMLEVNTSHSPNSSATVKPSTGSNSNESINEYSPHLLTTPVKNAISINTEEHKVTSNLLNKPQNYGSTRVRHIPPFPSHIPDSFLTINNWKGPKGPNSIESHGSSSSVTSRSHNSKLNQQHDSFYIPKIKYKELYFDCVDEISKPEKIGSDRYLGKATEVSNSFEATKEFPRNEYEPSLFSVDKLFHFIIAIISIFVSLMNLFYRKLHK